jgi:hypothetical protein
MNNKLKFKIYHGTSLEYGMNILRLKYYKFSEGKTEWLGKGAYFFIDNNKMYSEVIENARKWALNIKQFRDHCILESTLNIEENKYMDLDDKEWRQFFHEARKEVIKDIIQRGLHVKLDKSGELECYVIDEICESSDIHAVSQEKFVNFEPEYEERKIASSFVPNCKMLCVKNTNVIERKSIRIIEEGKVYG